MDKEKAKALSEILERCQKMQEIGSISSIEFQTTDGQKLGIENLDVINLLLNIAIVELERQLDVMRFGGVPRILENSREYKATRELEGVLNDYGFNSKRFAESLTYMHKTNCQSFFRLVKECILFMADEKNMYIDGRNRASHEMCKELAGIAKDSFLPFV